MLALQVEKDLCRIYLGPKECLFVRSPVIVIYYWMTVMIGEQIYSFYIPLLGRETF